jgi:hypothetical protein
VGHLPAVISLLLPQNCSSQYFMKQLDPPFHVVLACPKASKTYMAWSRKENVAELHTEVKLKSNSKRAGILHYPEGSRLFKSCHIEI